VGWLPRWKELGVVGSQEVFMFARGFIFEVIIPLYLVELSTLVVCDLVLLVENLDGMGLVGQVGFQWNGVLHNHISRRFRHPLIWEMWNTLCTPDSFDGSST
jgi:hypothetical protein